MKPRILRSLERLAIPDLTLYLVGGQGLALLLGLLQPGAASNLLLVPDAVLAGQWWRVPGFLFTPCCGNPFLAIFALYFLYFLGNALETHWGTARYNLYVLVGFAAALAAAFAMPHLAATNRYLTGSIFLAFAYLYPEFQILLFFVLPVRVKWLAMLTWLGYGYAFITGDGGDRLLIFAAVTNFLLFFGHDLFLRARYGHRRMRAQTRNIAAGKEARHVCTVCGVTDKSHPATEFRYCTKCEPPVAYCMDHLRDHPHRAEAPAPGPV